MSQPSYLLNSKTARVISDLQQINAKTKLCETKQKQVHNAITYFTNHQHKMNYKTFMEFRIQTEQKTKIGKAA